MSNGDRTTVGSNSRVTIGLLIAMVGLAFAAIGGWASVWSQASSALPRVEAYQSYVSKADYAQDEANITARLERMENKLDRLIEKGQ